MNEDDTAASYPKRQDPRGDVGLRLGGVLGLDLKWHFAKTQLFDAALDPGLQIVGLVTSEEAAIVGYAHLPLLMGINLGRDVTIVTTVGVAYTVVPGRGISSGEAAILANEGPWARVGLGLNLRPVGMPGLQPEVTVMRAIDDSESWFIAFGLGMTLGRLPEH